MSRNNAHHRTRNAVNGAPRRARQASARMRSAAKQVMPLAKTLGAAARHKADSTRAWAVPQVERAGHVVQDSVAPKVSSLLSAVARRLEPEKPPSRRWRKVAGISAAVAAASAVAAAVRGRVKPSADAAPNDLARAEGDTSGAETAPAMQTGNGQQSPASDIGQDSAARTS